MQYSVSFLFFAFIRVGCYTLIVFCFHVAVRALCLLLAVPWVGLWSVIVAFPGDTHLLLEMNDKTLETMITRYQQAISK